MMPALINLHTSSQNSRGEPCQAIPQAHPCKRLWSQTVTHRRVGTRKEHPKTEESEQRPPNHAKDAECCLRRIGLKKKNNRDYSGSETPQPHQCRVQPPANGSAPPLSDLCLLRENVRMQDSRRHMGKEMCCGFSSEAKIIPRCLSQQGPGNDSGEGYSQLKVVHQRRIFDTHPYTIPFTSVVFLNFPSQSPPYLP